MESLKKRIKGILALLLVMVVFVETPMWSNATDNEGHNYLLNDSFSYKESTADWISRSPAASTGTMNAGDTIKVDFSSGCVTRVYLDGVLVDGICVNSYADAINEGHLESNPVSEISPLDYPGYTLPSTSATYTYTYVAGNYSQNGAVIMVDGKILNYKTLYITSDSLPSGATNTTNTTNTGHTHGYSWKVTTPATAISDGVLSHICECGKVDATQVITANSFYLNDILTQITNASEGATLTFESNNWNSFPKSVMLALSERRDLTVVFEYSYEGTKYQVTIPAGAEVDTTESWYGPMKLVNLYDGVVISE